MARSRNTTRSGGSFSEDMKLAVWKRGAVITQKGQTFDSSIWRHDRCGYVMKYEDYGDVESKYGWEVDHINPVANGGTDDLNNLQPLYWKNNREKGDKLNWSCP